MAWISVYQEVDGPKLRRLARLLETSKAESLGILNFLWFWGMNNADETGKVLEASREDIEDALAGTTRIRPEAVVDALFEAGWLDVSGDDILIHDWDQWQEQWYKLQKNRKRDAERKRRDYAETVIQPREAPTENRTEESAKKSGEKKKAGPEKKTYAEFVKMTEANYARLVELYGESFTAACITKLDLYKGSKGKTYKDDYRAILSWVVRQVNEDNPGLMNKSRGESAGASPGGDNPYAEWGEASE